jgi:DnaK suppressor protein
MPLTPARLEHLHRRLMEERALILQDLERYTNEERDEEERERTGDLSVVPFHLADRGTDTMEGELSATNVTRQTAELYEIDAALERLYTAPEKFGICEVGGEEIPSERLDVVPWARTCIRHQSTGGSD